jgi:glycogen synthase
MRICLVSHEYPPDTARGGIGTQTWNKARALAARGHNVHVLTAAAEPDSARTYDEDGVTVQRLVPPGFDFPVHTAPGYWLGYSWTVFGALQRLLEQSSFDLVDFPEYGGEGYAYLLDRMKWNHVPVVVQLHGPLTMFGERIGWPERDSDLYRMVGAMEGVAIERADALMACSANIADFVADFYDVRRTDIDVVHCGVDLAAFPEREPATAPARPTVLFVGNVAKNKGVSVVCEAVLALRQKYPDVLLRIVGRADEDFADDLMERVRDVDGDENVRYEGFVRDRRMLPSYYREASVFASPAEHEVGVANVYIEAMAASCPVVAATTGGASEAVIDGETGVLVPPEDPAATAAALDAVLGDDALRRRLGSAGRERAEAYFGMEPYIERVLATYGKALARARHVHT